MPDEGNAGASASQAGVAGGTGTSSPAAGSAGAGATPSPAPATTFDWKTSGLDDQGLALVTERGWKGPGDVLQSYRNLETAVGVPPERLIKLPAQRDAGDPKVWNDVFTKLGKPASADKYNIPLPEGDKGEFAKVAKDWFHGANLTQSQASALAEKWNGYMKDQAAHAKTAQESKNLESISELKKAWGSQYEVNATLVDKAADAFGMTQEQLNGLKQALGPKDAMTFLHNIGTKLGVEEGTPKGMESTHGAGNTTHRITPEQAQAQLQALKLDKTFAAMFSSPDPAQRAEAREKINRLNLLAAPGNTIMP
jgi:hypothetical protein